MKQEVSYMAKLALLNKFDDMYKDLVHQTYERDYDSLYKLWVPNIINQKTWDEIVQPKVHVFIVYMNYSTSTVFQYDTWLPQGYQYEDVQKWLEENTSYDEDDCYFMCHNEHIEMYDGTGAGN